MTLPVSNKTEIKELMERVRAATGRDRELDFRVHIVCVEDAVWPVRDRLGRVTNPNYRRSEYLADYASVINLDDQDFDFPRYTASIDAALALVERVRPGTWWGVLDDASTSLWVAHAPKAPLDRLPLAILSALLQALQEEGK